MGDRLNKARREELEVGTDVTPDEMMFAWRGEKGNGRIPLVFGRSQTDSIRNGTKMCL